MRNQKYKSYIYWGVTAFCVLAACLVFLFLLLNYTQVKAAMSKLGGILAPITYGAVLAYLLTPVYNFFCRKLQPVLQTAGLREKRARGMSKGIATIVSLALLFAVIASLFWMLVPELINSVTNAVNSMMVELPQITQNLYKWLENTLKDNVYIEQMVLNFYQDGLTMFQDWSTNTLVPSLEKIITGVSLGMMNALLWIKDILIGIIVMVYVLNIKDTLSCQSKQIVYGFFPLKIANRILSEVRLAHKMFGGFITGKLLDSLIIGILCFACMSLMKMPYVLLVSVIIGVTNVIPFFGPFIGAIPSAVLILLVSPIQTIYFLIFVLLLQQFDGNILGPKILGDSTGLSSFWVLFSILLFGGVFGFVGMIVGVPAFAVIYNLITEAVKASLAKKQLSQDSQDYMDLDTIDAETRNYNRRSG